MYNWIHIHLVGNKYGEAWSQIIDTAMYASFAYTCMQREAATVEVNNLHTLLFIALMSFLRIFTRNAWQSGNGEYLGRRWMRY